MGHAATVGTEVASEHHVLAQPQGHADRGRTEAVVEAHVGLQQSGDQRAGKGTDVDSQVEQGEAAVAARVAMVIQRAQQRGGIGLERAGAQRDEDQAHGNAHQTRQDRQRDVAAHHHHAAVGDRALHSQHPVRHPAAKDRREIDEAAVSPTMPVAVAFRWAEAAVANQ